MLKEALKQCGLIAILRGIRPDEVEAVGLALYDAGFRIIEVPLNSPEPFESIRVLRNVLPANCMVGAGTVLSPAQVLQVKDAEGQLIVMPHSDPEVIRAATAAGLASAPGVATVTEAFGALAAGADILKMFPAEQLGPVVVKAWRAVIPASVMLVPVGGITPDSLKEFTAAGASAFGLGSALYKPGMTVEQVRKNADAFVSAWKQT
ncbi:MULTISPECIES: 2-dehydro-3-deoxy-6-phosphogalactonate aldolase [unclassified Herbaspirillum]|uniref:2-dehydro-3-deoxy-6-phosphogalactonate aldolase n=1 Tax=unclassified Herbaspirillum TaxID=2624150 RepID=UPI000E2F8D24|nr:MULTISPECIES: 2-dehydro-3-deoxy-6-phosphogalactonate aldolase [unclassified Herbaspirillum]RFB69407.1 2-dehydro-3-deoxy-6-phosphogalactonate aldolase [Herbaspirillum sp. 3R-3a1]TFI07541.1 2-dehydro-3-deoxy-6-phosphogalactonate aldolase [Herbaspirillum sp. 3R11]TFI12314.1 2-dehydro-3-deoxy-6-phosphogalactonate aldolase [Herbaspirillum sp. 3R-11]TFI29346.1 2-dehydro-3-deoxy-6-phosphogalactonate aldolase [Herbaspirillum sp. 3C11]